MANKPKPMPEGWLPVATRKEKLAVEWSQCEDMADFLTKLMTIREELLAHAVAADQRIAKLEKALLPFKKFADAFDANPINGLDPSEIYSIHGGDGVTEHGASLRWEHMRAAQKALGGGAEEGKA